MAGDREGSGPARTAAAGRGLRWQKLGLLAGTLLAIVVVDRAVHATFIRLGAIWRSDPVLGFAHRPGATSSWGKTYDDKPIRINAHGHHDDEFRERKADGEVRGLFLGDSIVMGHGVRASETFVHQLESLLAESPNGSGRSFQMINTGVQGYATTQYLEVFRRSLRFQPDFVVVGFCMNDLSEPLIFGGRAGAGIDYHLVEREALPAIDFLKNETGVGRLAAYVRYWMERDEIAREWATYGPRPIAEGKIPEARMRKAWSTVLGDLDAIYALARREDLPLLLLIFPEVFQLGHESLQRPQYVLKRHAERRGVAFLDVTKISERYVATGRSASDLYLDANHFTVEGHRLAARELLRKLVETGILPPGRPPPRDASRP